MQLNRRKMFGLVAAAPLAAPTLAGAANNSYMTLPPSSLMGSASMPTMPDKEWLSIKKERLLRIVGLGRDEERDGEPAWDLRSAAYQLDALRSVAPQHKVAMLREAERQLRNRQDVFYAKRELADMAKRFFGQ